jgi:hypothetical protein
MLKKTITYTDFNDEKQTEDFYFNLTRAELVKMELSGEGNSLSSQLQSIANAKDGKRIVEAMTKIIKQSYGVKSEDGKRFIKSEELSDAFEQTAAFSELFTEIATDADASAAFINNLVPADFAQSVGQQSAQISASEEARRRSEQSLQGHKKKQDHEANQTVDVVPELPTVGPDLEPIKPVEEKTLDELTPDELRARLAALEAAKSE